MVNVRIDVTARITQDHGIDPMEVRCRDYGITRYQEHCAETVIAVRRNRSGPGGGGDVRRVAGSRCRWPCCDDSELRVYPEFADHQRGRLGDVDEQRFDRAHGHLDIRPGVVRLGHP